MTILFSLFLFIFLLTSLLLTLLILVQEAKSLGLGASFGGDAGDSLFGTSTADVLKTATRYLAGIFLTLCLLLSVWSGSFAPVQHESLDSVSPPLPSALEESGE